MDYVCYVEIASRYREQRQRNKSANGKGTVHYYDDTV